MDASGWEPVGLIHLNTSYRCLQLLRVQSKTGLVASIHLGLGSGMTLRNPHMRQDPPPDPAKLTWGLGLKCQVLNQGQFFLASATEVILPMALDLVTKNQLHMV